MESVLLLCHTCEPGKALQSATPVLPTTSARRPGDTPSSFIAPSNSTKLNERVNERPTSR